MSCEGVWSVDFKGPHGWERIATAFMENGKYFGASTNHYSVGHYKEEGDELEISLTMRQYANLRTVLGVKSADPLQIKYKCKVTKNKITGTGMAKGIKKYKIQIRFTKIDDIK